MSTKDIALRFGLANYFHSRKNSERQRVRMLRQDRRIIRQHLQDRTLLATRTKNMRVTCGLIADYAMLGQF